MRSARLAAMAILVAACGGRTQGGNGAGGSRNVSDADVSQSVDDGNSDAGQSPNMDLPMPACLGGPGVGPINVYGVDCYAGGPPSGACNEDAPACTFCALPVLCSPTYGPRTFYSCACSGGAWSCTTTSQDAAVCSAGG